MPDSKTMSTGVMMKLMEGIRTDARDTRDQVIKVVARQEADRKSHDERHEENQNWRTQHTEQHKEIMASLSKVEKHTRKPAAAVVPAPIPINRNMVIKYGFFLVFLLIALIFALSGFPMPGVPGIK